WRFAGRLPYGEALALQKETVRRRVAKEIPDTLILVEHPPVITLGKMAKREHLLGSRPDVEVVETPRGGAGPYHGPGQIVGYPILDLTALNQDLRKYLGNLEEVMIRAAALHGVAAGRIEGMTGAWVGDRK